MILSYHYVLGIHAVKFPPLRKVGVVEVQHEPMGGYISSYNFLSLLILYSSVDRFLYMLKIGNMFSLSNKSSWSWSLCWGYCPSHCFNALCPSPWLIWCYPTFGFAYASIGSSKKRLKIHLFTSMLSVLIVYWLHMWLLILLCTMQRNLRRTKVTIRWWKPCIPKFVSFCLGTIQDDEWLT